MSLTVDVGGSRVELRCERAAFLPDWATLLVADAHFGKAQTFRRLGVPVPAGTTGSNLQRLSALVEATRARSVVFLGDLLHARQAQSAAVHAALRAWRLQHACLSLRLVRGNHDDRAGDPPADWGIEVVDEPWPLGPWALCHHPQPVSGRYSLAGHLHPAVSLGRGPDRLRLPCFHFGPQVGVLPAFGAFTGLHGVRAAPGDRLYAIAGDAVRAVPA